MNPTIKYRIVDTVMMNPTRAILFSSAAFLLTATLSAGVQNQTPSQTSDEHPEFPPGDGRELTMKVCSQCHELNVIAEHAETQLALRVLRVLRLMSYC